MTALLTEPIALIAGLLVLIVISALVFAGSRRPYLREIERLKEDLHRLLANGERDGRLAVNGREST